jgi:hypothetical protein
MATILCEPSAMERVGTFCLAHRLEPLKRHCLICETCDSYFNNPTTKVVAPCLYGGFIFVVVVTQGAAA